MARFRRYDAERSRGGQGGRGGQDGRNAWVPQLLLGAVLFWSAVLVLGTLSWRWLRGFEHVSPPEEEDTTSSIMVDVREDPGELAREPPASERDSIGRTAY